MGSHFTRRIRQSGKAKEEGDFERDWSSRIKAVSMRNSKEIEAEVQDGELFSKQHIHGSIADRDVL